MNLLMNSYIDWFSKVNFSANSELPHPSLLLAFKTLIKLRYVSLINFQTLMLTLSF